mmetsp:Transcript_24826/g.62461  ORF Transcript_24826/g.62461 Transcript_24826/m.62461 type:complete len:252 (+) Transcript_24826:828-1583(+)
MLPTTTAVGQEAGIPRSRFHLVADTRIRIAPRRPPSGFRCGGLVRKRRVGWTISARGDWRRFLAPERRRLWPASGCRFPTSPPSGRGRLFFVVFAVLLLVPCGQGVYRDVIDSRLEIPRHGTIDKLLPLHRFAVCSGRLLRVDELSSRGSRSRTTTRFCCARLPPSSSRRVLGFAALVIALLEKIRVHEDVVFGTVFLPRTRSFVSAFQAQLRQFLEEVRVAVSPEDARLHLATVLVNVATAHKLLDIVGV